MCEHLYPLRLVPVAREIVWGGDLLKRKYGKTAPFDKLAESWELTVRPDRVSSIGNGVCAGMTLAEYIGKYGGAVVGDRYRGDRFPLLIKFIDAREKLSVQVHPGDGYALSHGCDSGKTEMWYIVEAEPGAQIVYGLKEGLDASDLRRAVASRTVGDCLNYVDVHAGESYFIPSGLVHAIGAGVLIAEIQQNSDVTYRLYDYNRPDDSGRLRELHTEDACAVTQPYTAAEIEAARFSRAHGEGSLASCEYFSVTRLDIRGSADIRGNAYIYADDASFVCAQCVGGSGVMRCGGAEYPVSAGDSYFIPACTGDIGLSGEMTLLLSRAAMD